MEEQGNVATVADRLKKQLRHDIISVRGYAAMHHERYIEYLRDLRKARWSRDYNRAEEIIDDLRAFAEEAVHLQRKGGAAYGRLARLVTERGFAAPPETEALPTDPRFVQASEDALGTQQYGSRPPSGS